MPRFQIYLDASFKENEKNPLYFVEIEGDENMCYVTNAEVHLPETNEWLDFTPQFHSRQSYQERVSEIFAEKLQDYREWKGI